MKLIIPRDVEERLHAYVMSVDSEIAGMGKVSLNEEADTITVEEVMISEQTVTGATADLTPQAMAKWQTELVRAGGSPKHWKLWWHSHVNMAAYFSGTDTGTMDAQTESDWVISLVVNKRRERQARLDLYRPFRLFLDKVEIQIGNETEYEVPKDIADEVALKVKRTALPMGYGAPHANYSLPRESDYTYPELISITKTLEAQIEEYESRGQGETAECMDIAQELVEMYDELAELEVNAIVAEIIRDKARKLEAALYKLNPEYD